jgi:hypothetical protein
MCNTFSAQYGCLGGKTKGIITWRIEAHQWRARGPLAVMLGDELRWQYV